MQASETDAKGIQYMKEILPTATKLGVHREEAFRRAAEIVDKILKGAKPADIPVEQPTKFELALNAKTASSLGLRIPPSMLVRVDQLIE